MKPKFISAAEKINIQEATIRDLRYRLERVNKKNELFERIAKSVAELVALERGWRIDEN